MIAGAWLMLSVAATKLQAQDKGVVFKINYQLDSALLDKTTEPVQELFHELDKQINTRGSLQRFADSNYGQLVLPLSAEELAQGSQNIRGMDMGPDNGSFLFYKYEASYAAYSYFLADNSSGVLIEQFRNARQMKFSNSGAYIIATFTDRWGVYDISQHKFVFEAPYNQMYYENGYEPDNIKILNTEQCIILEHQAEVGVKGYLFSLREMKIQHTFADGDADNMSSETVPVSVSQDGNSIGFNAYNAEKKINYTVLYNIQKNTEIIRIKQSRFHTWAQHSNSCLIQDEKGLYEYKLEKGNKRYMVSGIRYEHFVYGYHDSFIISNPEPYAFNEGRVLLYNRRSGKLIKTLVGTGIELNAANPNYAVISRHYAGSVLFRFDNLIEVLSMEEKESLNITESGKYLIMGKANGQSIIDLENSQSLLDFEDRIRFDYFNEKTLQLVTINNLVLEFRALEDVSKAMYYFANEEGFLCFDHLNHYDASASLRDKLYFICKTHETDGPNWPIVHKDNRYFTPGIWMWSNNESNTVAAGKRNCSPGSVTDPETGVSYYSWSFGGSTTNYTAELAQTVDVPKVNFIVDAATGKVNLNNFSTKPLKIIKAAILYQCDVWNAAGSELMFSYFVDYFGGFLAITPDGYYTKSKDFEGKVALKIQDTLYEISQLNDNFYNPSILNALILNQSPQNRYKQNLQRGLATPPQLDILSDDSVHYRGENLATPKKGQRISLRLRMVNRGGGIAGYRVMNNNKLLYDESISSASTDTLIVPVTLNLGTGSNTIKVVAYSQDHTASEPKYITYNYTAPADKLKKPNLYAIAIGINQYQNSNYNLKYCVRDMQSFVDTMARNAAVLFDTLHITKFTDSEATRENIEKEMAYMQQHAKPDDVFMFYYAGHGIASEQEGSSDFNFVLHEVTQMNDPVNCGQYGLSGEAFKEGLKNIQANKQICFIDACNSGAITRGFDLRSASKETAIAKLNRYAGCAIFASTNQYQYASELDVLGHGVFTYVLLEALAGQAATPSCEITVSSIKLFLDTEVPRCTQQYRGSEQYPSATLYGQDFPIGLRCK